jgi:hypothetical protein
MVNVILIVLVIVVGLAYFAVRNKRKNRERAAKK